MTHDSYCAKKIIWEREIEMRYVNRTDCSLLPKTKEKKKKLIDLMRHCIFREVYIKKIRSTKGWNTNVFDSGNIFALHGHIP